MAKKPKSRGNGEGSVYKLPSGKYRAEVTLGYQKHIENGIEKKKRIYKTKSGFKRRKDALAYLDILKNGTEQLNVTFTQLYDDWSAQHYENVAKSTADVYKAAYNYYKDIWFLKMSVIKTEHLQRCINQCPKGRRTKEAMKTLGTLLYKHALARDIVNKDYATLCTLPRKEI